MVERYSQSLYESEVAELEKWGNSYRVMIHQQEPSNEAGTLYSRINVSIYASVYYGMTFRKRQEADPWIGQLYLPDTWDPQHFIEAADPFLFISNKFAVMKYHFNMQGVNLKTNDRVWTNLWLPIDMASLSDKQGGVAFLQINIDLVRLDGTDHKAPITLPMPSLTSSFDDLSFRSTSPESTASIPPRSE